MKVDVAIVGNGVAGTACAMRLARDGIESLLIGRGLPVDRPPLTKSSLADGVPRLLCDAARLEERGVDRLDGTVTSADLGLRTLTVETAAGETTVEAQRVVLATGLAYRRPPVPGLDGAFVNANPDALERLGPLLTSGPVDVVVVGAGLIGTESAATLAQAGHSVTLVDMLERPLDRLHDPLPELGRSTLEELGVVFHGGVAIESAGRVHARDRRARHARGGRDPRRYRRHSILSARPRARARAAPTVDHGGHARPGPRPRVRLR